MITYIIIQCVPPAEVETVVMRTAQLRWVGDGSEWGNSGSGSNSELYEGIAADRRKNGGVVVSGSANIYYYLSL